MEQKKKSKRDDIPGLLQGPFQVLGRRASIRRSALRGPGDTWICKLPWWGDVNLREWRGCGQSWGSGALFGSQARTVGAGRRLKPCVISSGTQPTSPWPDLLPSVVAPPGAWLPAPPQHRSHPAKLT